MSEVVLLVVGAVVGLLAGQGNELLRLRREEKRAIGRALKTMLVIRRHMFALKRLKELTEPFNLTAQQMAQVQHVIQSFIFPSMQGMLGKYEEAIDVVSGVKPLLGFSLAQKTQLAPVLMQYTGAVMQHEQVSALWLTLEGHISDLPALDRLILNLAKLHSIDMQDKVRRHLEKAMPLPDDAEKAFKEFTQTIQKSAAPQKQAG